MKEEPAENTKKRGNMKMKTELQKQLFALQDPGYREFHARLIPEFRKKILLEYARRCCGSSPGNLLEITARKPRRF